MKSTKKDALAAASVEFPTDRDGEEMKLMTTPALSPKASTGHKIEANRRRQSAFAMKELARQAQALSMGYE